jgi:hypothetical protein
MHLWKGFVLALLGTAFLHGARVTPAAETRTIGVPRRANAYPSLVAAGGFAAAAWGATTAAGRTDIYVATSRDSGRTFGPPVRVNQSAAEASLSGEQPPRLALIPHAGRSPAMVAVWTTKRAGATRLVSARSDDGGASFGAAVPVPGTDGPGNRGWESIAVAPDGSVVAVWLDHGALGAAAMNHADHVHTQPGRNADSVARAQLSKLFFARLGRDNNAHAIASGVCYCCKTALTTDKTGAIYAAWRNVYPGNVRDMAFSKSADGGRTFTPPVRISNDNWVLDGCPENGPAIAVDEHGRIHAAWATLVADAGANREPTLALYYATSEDGVRFTPRQQVPTAGVPRHPQLTLTPQGEIILAWDEFDAGSRRIAIVRGTAGSNGVARFTRQAIDSDAPAVYPAVASTGDSVLLLWTSGDTGQTVLRSTRLTP